MSSVKDSFGSKGYRELESGDGATSGNFFAIKAVGGADAVVAVTNRQGDDSSALLISSGDVIFVTATSVTVASGKVHAYIGG